MQIYSVGIDLVQTRCAEKEQLCIVRAMAALQTDQSAQAKAFVQIASPLSCDRFC
jgi:hypothetical protein